MSWPFIILMVIGVLPIVSLLTFLAYIYLPQVLFLMRNAYSEHWADKTEWWKKRRTPWQKRLPFPWVFGGFATVIHELWKDLVLAITFFYIKAKIKAKGGKEWSTADYFADRVAWTPDRDAIIVEDRTITFRQLDERSNAVGHWASSAASGVRPGEVVALLLETSPEYIMLWLGLCKAGVLAGLINTNLTREQLAHACKVALEHNRGSKLVVVSRSLLENVHEIQQSDALRGITVVCYEDWLVPELQTHSHAPVPAELRAGIRSTDVLFYVYTSGTTGMPKAAKITHWRNYTAGVAFSHLYGVRRNDRIYCALPLYHSAGGMIGVSLSWFNGAALVLPKKFSASRFWSDCRRYNVTVVQYIGELCRYLLAQPPSEDDTRHSVRIAIGNGLRPEVWRAFEQRYNVGCAEFYASTEGNVNLFNNRGRCGAIGYMSAVMQLIYKVRFLKLDPVSEEPLRGADGLCIEAQLGEAGEAVGYIDSADASRRFDGYTDSKSTQSKILCDVLRPGDRFFRSGDLLRWDPDGYIYFVDRIGDTFRWKGENVATTEVASALMALGAGVQECNVYGLSIPNLEGRAGAAAVRAVDGGSVDLELLYQGVTASLAHYARPVFIRMLCEMEVTATFKHRKVELVAEGFNPELTGGDLMYFRDERVKRFVPVDMGLYSQIINGEVRL